MRDTAPTHVSGSRPPTAMYHSGHRGTCFFSRAWQCCCSQHSWLVGPLLAADAARSCLALCAFSLRAAARDHECAPVPASFFLQRDPALAYFCWFGRLWWQPPRVRARRAFAHLHVSHRLLRPSTCTGFLPAEKPGPAYSPVCLPAAFGCACPAAAALCSSRHCLLALPRCRRVRPPMCNRRRARPRPAVSLAPVDSLANSASLHGLRDVVSVSLVTCKLCCTPCVAGYDQLARQLFETCGA